MVTSARFPAMGTDVEVLLHVDDTRQITDRVRFVQHFIEELEARWSRFRANSDICRINANPGQPVIVAPSTFQAVNAAVDAWVATAGRFDPTLGTALATAGYDRPFEQIRPISSPAGPAAPPGADVIELHSTTMAITVPMGVQLDLGGIGKGLAADLTVEALLDAGVSGALVNIGGDLRADGVSLDGLGWPVRLDCPGSADDRVVRLRRGAVCTSTSVKRQWETTNGREHHLRCPDTGRATTSDLLSASVIGARAAACEVLATCAVVDGSDGARAAIVERGATGVLVGLDGAIEELAGFEEFT